MLTERKSTSLFQTRGRAPGSFSRAAASVVREFRRAADECDKGCRQRGGKLVVLNVLATDQTGMLSYPNNGHRLDHPDTRTLARLAEEAGVDFRVVWMTRDATSNIQSGAHRFSHAGNVWSWGRLMGNQLDFATSEIHMLENGFFTCVDFSQIRTHMAAVDRLLSNGTGFADVEARKGRGSFSFDAAAKAAPQHQPSSGGLTALRGRGQVAMVAPLYEAYAALEQHCLSNRAFPPCAAPAASGDDPCFASSDALPRLLQSIAAAFTAEAPPIARGLKQLP